MISRMTAKRNIFLGEADSYTIITENIQSQELLRKIRIAALLYDHAILAAAYFWQSEELGSVLPYLATLIGSGDVLPSIRSPQLTRDVRDYFEKRIEDTAELGNSSIFRIKPLASEIAKPSQRPIAEKIDNMGALVHVDMGSVEAYFRHLWREDAADMENPNSIYNILLVFSDSDNYSSRSQQIYSIADLAFFSRSVIAQGLYNISLPRQLRVALIDRASTLYLQANALACGSELLLSKRSNMSLGEAPLQGSIGPLAAANVSLFSRTLHLCGISPRDLDRLSDEELIMIKYSEEFYEFKELYFRLVDAALAEQSEFTESVWRRFQQLRGQDRAITRVIRVLKYVEMASGALFAAALGAVVQQATVPGQAMMAASGAAAGASRVLSRIKRLNSTPIENFSRFIENKEYQKRLRASVRLPRLCERGLGNQDLVAIPASRSVTKLTKRGHSLPHRVHPMANLVSAD